jgi:hypothetical protein
LIPNQFVIVTATTVILVGVILTVYIYLLKKNGWIGNNVESTTSIPVFNKSVQKNVENKTFPTAKRNDAATPKPEPSRFISSNKRPLGEVMLQSKTEFKARYSTPKISEKQVFTINTHSNEHKVEKTVLSEEKVDSQKINPDQIIKQENFNVKKENPEGCKNFLGYLREHPKSNPLPDECFACTNLIGCTTEVALKPKEKENIQTTNNESLIKHEYINIKKEKPQGCNNFLGYLNVLPKGTPLPDECFACSKLIDCVTKKE